MGSISNIVTGWLKVWLTLTTSPEWKNSDINNSTLSILNIYLISICNKSLTMGEHIKIGHYMLGKTIGSGGFARVRGSHRIIQKADISSLALPSPWRYSIKKRWKTKTWSLKYCFLFKGQKGNQNSQIHHPSSCHQTILSAWYFQGDLCCYGAGQKWLALWVSSGAWSHLKYRSKLFLADYHGSRMGTFAPSCS